MQYTKKLLAEIVADVSLTKMRIKFSTSAATLSNKVIFSKNKGKQPFSAPRKPSAIASFRPQ